MKQTSSLLQWAGFGLTTLGGTLLHFLYDWTGGSIWVPPNGVTITTGQSGPRSQRRLAALLEVAVQQTQQSLAVASLVTSHLHQSLRCARDCGGNALIYKAFLTFMIQDTPPKVNGNVCEPVSSEHIRRKKQWHKHRI